MRIRMIIFGLDGVICHLDSCHYLAWKEIADELGLPFSREQARALSGLSRMDGLDILLEGYAGKLSKAEKLVLAEQRDEAFLKLVEGLGPQDAEPEAAAVLTGLKERGYLLTAAPEGRHTVTLLHRLSLFSLFDYVETGGRYLKPSPQMYEHLCRANSVAPAECVAVDADGAGREAAVTAGLQAVSGFTELLLGLG